jgi:hypothetical protein
MQQTAIRSETANSPAFLAGDHSSAAMDFFTPKMHVGGGHLRRKLHVAVTASLYDHNKHQKSPEKWA